MNTAISPRKKSPTPATHTTSSSTTSTAPAAPDAFAGAAAEASHKLDLVHRMLFKEAAGESLTADEIDLVSALGWDAQQLKSAKRDATCGRSAVKLFKQTTGADARAKQLRAERDEQVPKLREQIAALEQQIGELEYAPRKAERQAAQHTEAMKAIRLNAPAFVKARFKLASELKIDPMRQRWSTMRGELGKLTALLHHDPQEPLHRHTFEATRDRNGDAPWLLTDAHGRTVIDPQAWRRFIIKEDVPARHDALAAEVAELESQIEMAEAEAMTLLDYWLHLDDDQSGASA